LRLGGRVFDRGLGTQSRTLLAYKLEPGSKRFQALIGLDDRAGPLGNVVFKVRVDDKIGYESTTMVAGEAPKFVDIDITGARFLILMTEFGERGDVQDHADWVEARIVR
jgi:NPCBM/NEW2 domain